MISLPTVKPIAEANGVILYRGPSMINGKPIVVVAIGLRKASANEKTGASFVQTYILSDEEERPTDAINSGKDESVCGDCIHRKVNGWATCYVNAGQGPNAVHDAMKRGIYPTVSEGQIDQIFAGRIVRFGAYGDPAAAPTAIWARIARVAAGRTGYTHQWRKCDPELKKYVMASVETAAGRERARRMGWKTFRVRSQEEPIAENEFACPASEEAGKRLSCEECLACRGGEWNGTQVTPVIVVHGMSWKPVRFRKMQKRMRNKKRYRTLQPA